MLDAGFQPDFPPEVSREVQALKHAAPKIPGTSATCVRCCGRRSTTTARATWTRWNTSKNFRTAPRVCWWGLRMWMPPSPKVPPSTSMPRAETTSVYTGVATFPMLPDELSTDLTSLLDAQDRLSIVIELQVLDSGEVKCHDVYPAWLRNRAKLAYSSTGAWLEGRGPIPPAVAGVPGMEAQLRLQLETSAKLARPSASNMARSPSAPSRPRRWCKMAKSRIWPSASTTSPRTSSKVSWWPRMWPWRNISRRKARSPSAAW